MAIPGDVIAAANALRQEVRDRLPIINITWSRVFVFEPNAKDQADWCLSAVLSRKPGHGELLPDRFQGFRVFWHVAGSMRVS